MLEGILIQDGTPNSLDHRLRNDWHVDAVSVVEGVDDDDAGAAADVVSIGRWVILL